VIDKNARDRSGTTSKNPQETAFPKSDAAKSAAFQPDPDLTMIVDRWPLLPDYIKLAVLALVKSSA
jgi:hypothetical protein